MDPKIYYDPIEMYYSHYERNIISLKDMNKYINEYLVALKKNSNQGG